MDKFIKVIMASIVILGVISGIYTSASAAQIYAQCDTYINIHQTYDLDSECVGKIYNGNVAEIINEIPNAYLIESGNVRGWVKKDYFSTEAPDDGYTVATVYPEQLNVRSAPSEESDLFGKVYANQQIEAVNYENGWVTLAFEDGTYGYVDANYVGLETYYGTAKTIEQESQHEQVENIEYNYQNYQYDVSSNNQFQDYEYDISLNAAATDYSQQDTSYVEPVSQAPASSEPAPIVEENTTTTETESLTQDNTNATTANTNTTTTNSDGQYLSNYAKQYIGNPYVYGGESLSTGADCSGFTKAVLNANGIQVNGRTAADQAAGGTKISLSEAQAGDLIYYDNGNGVYHIAIYNGDGTVTHSSNSVSGVKISDMNYSGNAAGAVRYW